MRKSCHSIRGHFADGQKEEGERTRKRENLGERENTTKERQVKDREERIVKCKDMQLIEGTITIKK